MELKYYGSYTASEIANSSNRTFMELKFDDVAFMIKSIMF